MGSTNPSNSSQSQAQAPGGDSNAELSLADIIQFTLAHYRKLILAMLLGGLLGFLSWYFLVNYQAQLTLINGNQADGSRSEGGLDLVSWRTIAQSLPNLADQMVQEDKAPEGTQALYRQMSDPAWWQKNVQPTYALSKSDMKDLATIGKELDGASTKIVSLTVSGVGSSRELAIDNVRQSSRFILSGGAYLQLRNVLNGYESEAIATRAEIERQISTNQIELSFLQARADSLESLLKRFPAEQRVAAQVVDPKDSGAKYLPIGTQIIALNTEIYQKRETLQRLGDRLAQIEIMNRFLQQALPQSQSQFDGVLLTDQLLDSEQALRKTLVPADLKAQLPLDQLRAHLLGIKNRFTKGLEANVVPNAKKRGMIKTSVGGVALAFALALIWLLGRPLLRRFGSSQS